MVSASPYISTLSPMVISFLALVAASASGHFDASRARLLEENEKVSAKNKEASAH